MSSLADKVVKGSQWVFLLKIFERVLAMVRLFLLARILQPDDFGVFAAALLVISSVEIFTRFGFEEALLFKKDNIEQYSHVAFFMQVVKSVIIFAIVFILSPVFASYFEVKELTNVIRVLVIAQLFIGFRSIGLVLLRKKIAFAEQTILQFFGFISNLIVSVAGAYIYQSVWSLVFGYLISELIITIGSYFIHEYRAKWVYDPKIIKDLFKFGIWLLLATILSFVTQNGDKAILGKLLPIKILGAYYLAQTLSTSIISFVTKPISNVLKSAYCEIQDETERLQNGIYNAAGIISVFVFPTCFGLFVISSELTNIFLGDKWIHVATLLPVFMIGRMFEGMSHIIAPIFIAKGQTKYNFYLQLVSSLTLVVSIYPLFLQYGYMGIAYSNLFTMFIRFVFVYIFTVRIVKLSSTFFKNMLPSLFSSVIMYTYAKFIILQFNITILTLTLLIISSAMIYLLSINIFVVYFKKNFSHLFYLHDMKQKLIGKIMKRQKHET